jgi:GTP-binding protein YchF
MRVGIVGLTMSGKSSLFEVLTGMPAPAPGSRPEPRLAVARVPDERVDSLAGMFKPKKTTYASVEYVDVPGVAPGQSAALVDLPALRGVDALVHVVRAFEDDAVPHPEGSIDPLRDVHMLDLELILADLAAVERRIERLEANIKKARRAEDVAERDIFLKLKTGLEAEQPLRDLALDADDRRRLRSYGLLTEKPMLLVVNLAEDQLRARAEYLEQSGLAGLSQEGRVEVCAVSAPIEAEISRLASADAKPFMEDLGLDEPGLNRVLRASYGLLGLISFLTAGEDECRAWTIRRGTRAREAAGAVHSDIERGFIRAEVVSFPDLVSAGSFAAARERGSLRLEGKDYVVADGDVVHFRFNV